MELSKQSNCNIEFLMNIKKSRKNFNYKNNENFRISNSSIFFNDDIWDFNYLNVNNRRKTRYRYNFTNIPSQFTFIIKHLILNEVFYKKNSFGSAERVYSEVSRFLREIDEMGVSNILMLDKKSLEIYINEKQKTLSNNSVERLCTHIVKVIELLEEITEKKFSGAKSFIKQTAKECRIFRDAYSAKNDYIPDSFLNQTISLAIKDMNDENLDLGRRIVACLIVIIAETGMRGEEVSLLESGMLDTINIESTNKVVNYLKFKTFKTQSSTGEYTETFCYLPPNATNAYIMAEKLMNECVDLKRTEESRLRSIVIAANREDEIEKTKKGRISILSLRKIVSSISDEEMEKIDKIRRKYLYVDYKWGRQKRGSDVFRNDLVSFYIRHKDDISLDDINQSDIDNLNQFMFTSESKFEREFTVEQRKNIKYEDVIDDIYYYVNPHRFRVTMCTKLFAGNVHLDYIVKHMNHLSEDMTVYYNKAFQAKDELEESMKILALMSKDSNGLIETDIEKVNNVTYKTLLSDNILKENIDKMNSFLKENDFNILTDIDIILKKLKKLSAPVAANDLGVCINIISQSVCEKREIFYSTIDLQITLPTYKNINYTYDLYKERVKIVKHNKEISDNNNIYNNEYEREVNSLKHLINTKLKKELDLLQEDLNKLGRDSVIEKYPYLDHIVKNISNINKEIKIWN